VCSASQAPSHALAGFFGELTQLKDPRVADLMQSWGIYFRQLPLENAPLDTAPSEAAGEVP
jgi:hypothetical protein